MSNFNTINPRPCFQTFYPEGYHEKTIKVSAEVVFGSPSKNCDGYGVCMLTSRKEVMQRPYRCEATPCDALFMKDKGSLVLVFEKAHLSEPTAEKFFRDKQHFMVEESYRLSLHLLRKGGFEGAWYIAAGNYRIQEQKQQWRISIPVLPMQSLPKTGIHEALEVLRAANRKVLMKRAEG